MHSEWTLICAIQFFQYFQQPSSTCHTHGPHTFHQCRLYNSTQCGTQAPTFQLQGYM